MPDALAVLRAGHPALPRGILIPEVMIRAAQLEDVELAVAASILEGETAGGKNIWGADGGLKVYTAGTYVPRTTVTRDNYLAYRAAMRAGKIKRQGAGPCQATSAQYQDTADALGGCWDMLANCRSGFRGMGALMKRYGVRNGARRYNGAGPMAEAYADRFMTKYNRWRSLLAGASVPNVSVPAAQPAAPPKPKGIPDMIERRLTVGHNHGRVVCPAEARSKIAAEVWVSVSGEGGCKGRVAFQVNSNTTGAPAGSGPPWDMNLANGNRVAVRMPATTEFIEYWITVNGVQGAGEGSLLVEFVPK